MHLTTTNRGYLRCVGGLLAAGAIAACVASAARCQVDAHAAAVAKTIRALSSTDAAVRQAAIKQCGCLKDAAVGKVLAHAYDVGPPAERLAILGAVARRRDRSDLPLAVEALGSDRPDLAFAGVNACASIGGADVVRPLAIAAAAARQANIGLAAERALIALRGPAVENTLARQALNAAPDIRAELIDVLRQRKSPLGLAVYLDAAKDRRAIVASAAFRALAECAGPAQHRELIEAMWAARDPSVRRAAELAVAANVPRFARAEDGLAPIIAALQATSGTVRHSAMAVLGAVGGEAPLREIGTALSAARTADDKRAALEALRGCRLPGAVAAAARCLDDPEVAADAAETVLDLAIARERGERALPAVAGPDVTDALGKIAASGPTEELRARAAKLLGR